MKNKKIAMRLAGLTTFVMLAACSQNGGGGAGKAPDESGKEAAPAAPAASTQPAEVVFYSDNGDSAASFDARFGESLRKKFPNYTIRYIQRTGTGTYLPDLIASKTRFDIFFTTIGNFEARVFPNGIEYDMTELIKKHQVDLNRLDQSVVNAVKQASGGKLYGLPIFTSNLVLYYNKDLFDKYGVPYPKDGMIWEDMMAAAQKLTRVEGDKQDYGFSHSPSHSFRLNPLSIPNSDLQTDKPTINQDERWKTYFDMFYMQPKQLPGYLEAVKALGKLPSSFVGEKNLAMYAYLSSEINVWGDQLQGVNWDIVSLPTTKERQGIGSQSYPAYFGITKMAENKDAVMEVLKYMLSDEFQTEIARKGVIPVLDNAQIKKELGQGSQYKDKNWSAVFYNKFAPIPPKTLYDANLVDIYTSYGNQIALDKVDLNTALRMAEEEATKKIQTIQGK
ncbi:extracellular solute-binding protein [Paenibacillus hodogayensis]|uniref:Extracellular solute-binding protein n=1 Tax=Paenibacillus hodogayensis TaxID=279208 RepID=A0ABV5VPR9_9BACL